MPVAFTPSFPALPQYVAQAEGFYKAHGLDVEPVQVAAGPEMGAAMIGGDITYAGNIPNNQITLKDAGFDVVGVAQQVGSQFFDLAVSSKYDLKGATEWQDVMKALKGARRSAWWPTAPRPRTSPAPSSTRPEWIPMLRPTSPPVCRTPRWPR